MLLSTIIFLIIKNIHYISYILTTELKPLLKAKIHAFITLSRIDIDSPIITTADSTIQVFIGYHAESPMIPQKYDSSNIIKHESDWTARTIEVFNFCSTTNIPVNS